MGRKTSRKRYGQKVKAMNEWLRKESRQMPLRQGWNVFRVKLAGHYQH